MSEALPVLEVHEVQEHQLEKQPLVPWNVVLLDDDDHTYDYVIEMLHRLFCHPIPLCYQMALEVDTCGRVIVYTTNQERAELEAARIHAYGADPRISRCAGSMSAIIEPACGNS
ncbi:MAG: ATP-dependent Clp protease adaptor ClpS [Candidatus Eremiobacterota bacterium]